MVFGLFGKKDKKYDEIFAGKAVHYFPKVKAAVFKMEKGSLSVGDMIRVKGNTTDFQQKVGSMQIQHEVVKSVKKGQEVAIQVKKKVRRGDQFFLLRPKEG